MGGAVGETVAAAGDGELGAGAGVFSEEAEHRGIDGGETGEHGAGVGWGG